jgi:hypothetical protein
MAYYQPPVPLKQDKFNSAGFEDPTGSLTVEEADTRYLRFPTAQGTENFADVNVSGDLTITNTSSNLALGYQSGLNLVSASSLENTFIGYNSGKGVAAYTLSSDNTAVGYGTLENMDDVNNQNTAVGSGALAVAQSSRNTAVGYRAGIAISSGTGNTCIGRDTGLLISTGSSNTCIGEDTANSTLTTGSSNTFVGTGSGTSLATVSSSTAIGAGATVSASNTIVLGRSSETVRLRTLKPLTDTTDLTIGAGSTGNISFNISDTNPLTLGTTPMVNFESSWWYLEPVINTSYQPMIITEFYTNTGLNSRSYYYYPINFIPRFFTARFENRGAFTGTGVGIKFLIYKNASTSNVLAESTLATIISGTDDVYGSFSTPVSTTDNNDAIYVALQLNYTTLSALNRGIFFKFWGQQTP